MQAPPPSQPAAAAPAAPPASWPLYLPAVDYDAQDRRALLEYVLPLDFQALHQLTGCSAELESAMELEPLEALACVAAAAHEALFVVHKERAASLAAAAQGPGRVAVRLHSYGQLMHMRQLKSQAIGRLVTIRGTVVRMSHIRPLIVEMGFTCVKCGAEQHAAFPDGRFAPPTRCAANGCRSRTFTPDRPTAKCIDWQKIRVQELLGSDVQQQGRVPRTVEVELKQDLVSSCVVGDVVTVLGLVKVLATGDQGKGRQGQQQQSIFLLYLDAVSVANSKRAVQQGAAPAAAAPPHAVGGQPPQAGAAAAAAAAQQAAAALTALPPNMPDFSVRDLQFVLTFLGEYASQEYEGDAMRQLSHALCPAIYGHEVVKAGLLLALLGGVRKNADSANRVPIRGDIHVLLVGDPGLGKSQLLQAVAAAAPRGLYICGNTSTGAGLTVSVVRDPVTGDSMFEAGAVVLGDRGVCCVDEFDKMGGEHQALLEAMEQQQVSVAKAGLVASLPARTSIVAAANPAGGHFDRGKTLQARRGAAPRGGAGIPSFENLRLSPAMLSRFDLAFVLLDRPDELLDQALSEHVMALHSGLAERAAAARQRLLQHRSTAGGSQLSSQQTGGSQRRGGDGRGAGGTQQAPASLKQRLQMSGVDAESSAPLPMQLLRKYIAYARAHVHPVLSDEARDALQAFYLQLRADSAAPMAGGGAPITARQLESLVRLAEARARVDLREEVTREDAEDAIEIMSEALLDRCGGGGGGLGLGAGLGLVDFRKDKGSRGGRAGESARFMAALRRGAAREGRDTFDKGELQELASELKLNIRDVHTFIDQLNEAGEILKRGPGQYKVSGVAAAAQRPSDSQAGSFFAAGGGGGGDGGGGEFGGSQF
ncbi:MAG: MCM2/3/5 family-domain-containing protein [Monoraphidium minutum]|nr:MAG: MCM2/3/5 family-domain-containing protein [Monoraphidium minutum]